MRPGWQTTEFWVTIVIQLFSIVTIAGIYDPKISADVTAALPVKVQDALDIINAAIAYGKDIAAFVAMAVSGFGYSKARAITKAKATE